MLVFVFFLILFVFFQMYFDLQCEPLKCLIQCQCTAHFSQVNAISLANVIILQSISQQMAARLLLFQPMYFYKIFESKPKVHSMFVCQRGRGADGTGEKKPHIMIYNKGEVFFFSILNPIEDLTKCDQGSFHFHTK